MLRNLGLRVLGLLGLRSLGLRVLWFRAFGWLELKGRRALWFSGFWVWGSDLMAVRRACYAMLGLRARDLKGGLRFPGWGLWGLRVRLWAIMRAIMALGYLSGLCRGSEVLWLSWGRDRSHLSGSASRLAVGVRDLHATNPASV